MRKCVQRVRLWENKKRLTCFEMPEPHRTINIDKNNKLLMAIGPPPPAAELPKWYLLKSRQFERIQS